MLTFPGVQQSLSLQFCSLLCVRHVDAQEKNIKSKAPPMVREYTGTKDCFRLRGTSTISIMLRIICIHTELHGRETNKSNCGREHINGRRTEFR